MSKLIASKVVTERPPKRVPRRHRVVVLDGQEIWRAGILSCLRNTEFRVLKTTQQASAALELAALSKVDIVILDIDMFEDGGIKVMDDLRHANPHIHLVVLTQSTHTRDLDRSYGAGAAAYLLKETSGELLVRALRSVIAGKHTQNASRHFFLPLASNLPNLANFEFTLTKRETEILRLLPTGLSNLKIAARLKISVDTVRTHVCNVIFKLNVMDRTEAAVWAIRYGFGPL